MTAIPHDYYLKFVDSAVLDRINGFHCLTNYTMHESLQHITYLHGLPSDTLKTLTGNELPIYPDLTVSIPGSAIAPLPEGHPLRRIPSCDHFCAGNVSFDDVKRLLGALVESDDQSQKRGYPSGGALYPVEVFILNLSAQVAGWPSEARLLHLLAASKGLEPVTGTESACSFGKALFPAPSSIGQPDIAIIYTAYLPKNIFKYRYRGYRLAQLEAGSMYMLTDLACTHLKLSNRLWAGYCDDMLCKSMGLNPLLFLPLCVQFIGGNYE